MIRHTLLAVAVTVLCTTACEASSSNPATESSQAAASDTADGSAKFRARQSTAAVPAITWTASGGTISSTGLFTAPSVPGPYVVGATVGGVTGSATAIVVGPGSPADHFATVSSACAAMPVRSTGTKVYVCDCQAGAQAGCVAGNDANAGTISAAPKRTWSAAVAAFNALPAGGTVAFCKGGAIDAGTSSLRFSNANCRANPDMMATANTNTCDFRDYDPSWGGTAKPIIKHTSGNLMEFRNAAHREGYRVLNLALTGSGTGPGRATNQWAIWLTDDTDDVLICNNTFNYWGMALYAGVATAGQMSRWRFAGNRVLNSSTQGILCSGDDSQIDANYFDSNGSSNDRDHTVYCGFRQGQHNLSVTNNQFYYTSSSCSGVVIVQHGQATGTLIENNVIDGGDSPTGSCYGISVGRGYSEGEAFSNVVVRRNRISRTGNVVIEMDAVQDPVVENNIIYSPRGGTDVAIGVPYQTANTGKGDTPSTRATIRNNTLYIDNGTKGIHVAAEGTGHVVANNSIFFTGTANTCFTTGLAAGAFTFAGNNACFGYSSWGNTAIDTVGRVTSNPLYTAAPTDFSPQAGSPLKGAGNSTHAPSTDINLKSRPTPVSIGAIEP
jgi:hypothetical protein